MTRFMCERGVTAPEELRAFRGHGGAWAFVPEQSDERTIAAVSARLEDDAYYR